MKMTSFEKLALDCNTKVKDIDPQIIRWAIDTFKPFGNIEELPGTYKSINICTPPYGCCRTTAVFYPQKVTTDCKVNKNFVWHRRPNDDMIFCVMQNYTKELKIIRTFKLVVNDKKNAKIITSTPLEICRHWIATTGESAVIGKPIFMGKIVHCMPMNIRHRNRILYDYYADIAIRYPKMPIRMFHPVLESEIELPPSSTYSFVISALECQL